MKAIWLVAPAMLAAGLCAWLPAQTAPAADPDPLLRALRDELERSRQLNVPGLERPYFIQYRVDEVDSLTVSATLGGVISRRRSSARLPGVEVRVGDYRFDNSNYAAFGFGSNYGTGPLPVEDDYGVMRRFFWLGTDTAYKGAVEAIARKRAALRNLTVAEEINDFAKAKPVKRLEALRPLAIDEDEWTRRVRSLSAIFARYPEVRTSRVDLEAGMGGFYLVNSEATEVRVPQGTTYLRIRASAQAKDGMMVRDSAGFHALEPTRMALDPELQRAVNAVAANVVALSNAPRGEDYNGPVLFEGIAAAQLFAEVLGKNLVIPRKPVTEPGRGGSPTPSELEGRQGARILPEHFNVTDDPTQKEWRGRPLFGSYEIDREGVVPEPLPLVENGVLKAFLMTRQPVRGFEGSNGRARLPGMFGAQAAAVSNLFVSASDTVPAGAMKKQLIETIRSRNKPFGIIVRKMDYPSSAGLAEAQSLLSAQAGSGHPVSLPLLVYKVFADGREELVRGLHFRGLNARSLKDIMAAGNDYNLFEFLDSNAPFALMDASNFASETSVVAPSVLIDDLELHPIENEQPKLPIAPPPDLVQ